MVEADVVHRLIRVFVLVADLRPRFGSEFEAHDCARGFGRRARKRPRARMRRRGGRAADSIVERGSLIAEQRLAVKDFVPVDRIKRSGRISVVGGRPFWMNSLMPAEAARGFAPAAVLRPHGSWQS